MGHGAEQERGVCEVLLIAAPHHSTHRDQRCSDMNECTEWYLSGQEWVT